MVGRDPSYGFVLMACSFQTRFLEWRDNLSTGCMVPPSALWRELPRTPLWRSSQNTPSTPGDGEGLPRVALGPAGPTPHEVGYLARLAKRRDDGVSRR